jgi:hypothetical protein
MRLTVGLSGWTQNDWTHGSALDLLMPPVQLSPGLVTGVAGWLQRSRAASLADAGLRSVAGAAECAAALNHLARAGQVIYDLDAGKYRWRQIMPSAVGEADIGPEPPELVASRELIRRRAARVTSTQALEGGGKLIQGRCDRTPVELLLDGDGRIKRAKCECSHFFKAGIRKGPCRHLLALRDAAERAGEQAQTLDDWFARWKRWSSN